MYCAKCGTENLNEAKFCKKCGAELTRNIQKKQEQVQSPVKKKKSRVGLIVAVVIILAAIAGGGLFVMKYIEEKRIEKNAEDYRKYMSDADKYLEELDYKKAEDSYLKAIEIAPKEKEPYLKLADVYVVQEKYDEAVDILEKAEKAIDKEDSDINQKKEEIEKREEYTWVVEPTVEADEIGYVSENSVLYAYSDSNGVGRQFKSPYAVIRKGSILGIIDMRGNLKAELEYGTILKSTYYDKYILKRVTPKYSEKFQRDWESYSLDSDGNLREASPVECNATAGEIRYYWYEQLHCVGEEKLPEMLRTPKRAIPVKQAENICSGGDWVDLESPYAICNEGKLVTDFEYDLCGLCSDGLLAVCKDGKWGYVNESGEIMIPIEYDCSWGEKRCYAASDGYVNLCKDNKWELRDTDGNLVILPGIFEQILPVYEGKCWVKKNGKWGVIQLKKFEKEEMPDNQKIASDTYKDIYVNIYTPIIRDVYDTYGEGNLYYFHDIDKDGIMELIIEEGTCAADYMYQVYTIRDMESKYLGEIPGSNASFYEDENGRNDKYIICVQDHMGYERISRISIENEQVVKVEISSREVSMEEDYYSNEYPLAHENVISNKLLME